MFKGRSVRPAILDSPFLRKQKFLNAWWRRVLGLASAGGGCIPEWVTPIAIHSKCGESGGDLAINAIDNQTWSDWNHDASCKHWIIFDMGETKTITKVRLYQPGTVGNWGGLYDGFYVYVGDDPADLGDYVWSGIQTESGWCETGSFEKDGRYVKLQSKSTYSGQRMGEFNAFCCDEMPGFKLDVNSFDGATPPNNFKVYGVSPYLDKDDGLTNYVYMDEGGAAFLGYFRFAHAAVYPSGLYLGVVFKRRLTHYTEIRFRIFCDDTYIGYKTFSWATGDFHHEWGAFECDISDFLDTLAKLNGAKLDLWYQAGAFFDITQVYLRCVV